MYLKAKRIGFIVVLLFLAVHISAQTDTLTQVRIHSRIDRLINQLLPAGSTVGISVYDLTAKAALYNYQGDKLSRPASTMKLLTTITSLARPDVDDPFITEVWYKGEIANDTLHGDLYVVGGFDPEFDDKALELLVDSVSRLPLSVIDGHVYGDISMKDSLYWGAGWAWDDTPYSYQPYLSPLMFNKGVVTVIAAPGLRGDTAHLECSPVSSYYTVINQTKTRVPAAGSFNVSRNWLQNKNNICVTGNVSGRRSDDVNIYSSQDFFMCTFLDRLRLKGINCSSGYAFKMLQKDTASVRIGSYETDMQSVVTQTLKESDNLNAQALLCRLGMKATGKKWISDEDGLSAMRLFIKQLGDDPDRYNLADGCGLSNYDYISPDLLVEFLRFAYSRTDVFQKLYKALPIGGVDGTLKNRMKAGTHAYKNVHAKTGSYTAINCLAGYMKTKNGHEIAFAIMNQNILSGAKARVFQDAVCDEIIKSVP